MASRLEVAAKYDVDVDSAEQVAAFYDMLFRAWDESPAGERSDPNTSINLVGIVFGEHIVRRTSMRWVVATDSAGTELAVFDPETTFLVYPANAVAKRWTNSEPGAFIVAMADDIATRLSE
ncbi:DUF3806 domain-containing protein [Galbitalea soli]|uniref:DUF3806 domain-containing protein n=1 Tax=Galbitalea soli TaxID=1268042 RepID=A0A7C9TPR6_9MICO|nr:DUF3806 domain-containing protein [Galbitalea soli]NEM90916.1 DUF3806 domain-containing protein [Galbitalea soli]NYJ29602.1 hypothetical protein [Galbitalea soli]